MTDLYGSLSNFRKDFPLLNQQINNHPLVYLDNAATAQKPKVVLDFMQDYYQHYNSNIHRGVHTLSEKASLLYETARQKIQKHLNAAHPSECIFVRGTTEGINLVAETYGQHAVSKGDEILITAMEHHSNIVPWQQLCNRRGAVLKVIPITPQGELDLSGLPSLLTPKTKMLAITHVSNTLGTVNPIKKIIATAHAAGVPVLVDGAQAVPHLKVDVQDLDCDFYVFSGHKLFGPTGIGVLYGKQKWLDALPPYQSGGGMILEVHFEKTTFARAPAKFEAGTPAIAEAAAMGCVIDYLQGLNFDDIARHEHTLLQETEQQLREIPGLRIIGEAKEKVSVVSFVMEGIHPHDIGTILDQEGIAIRAGHHCTMPLMEYYQIPATARASFAFYNTAEEAKQLIQALYKVKQIFKK